jgi:hypothetical protein
MDYQARKLESERRVALEAIGHLRAGRVRKAGDILAREISMGEVEGEWIALATGALIRRGGLRGLLTDVGNCLWNDILAGEIDAAEVGAESIDAPDAWRRCLSYGLQQIRDALGQWRMTHIEDYHAETPRGRRLARSFRRERRVTA